ncbi:MAG: SDR family NAD(P)-dependent oxidoreductase [Actinomycetes bacterium]
MPAEPPAPTGFARAIDSALEASIVGSFTRIGPVVRRRLSSFAEPVHRPGRTVVLTGATSGLGRASARFLGALGMTVVAVGRDPRRLEEVAREIEIAGGTAYPEACDLADLDQTADLAERITRRLDHIDVLVHNAGALLAERTETPQGHETTVAVHLLSPHLLTVRLRPLLKVADQAKVITMTSGGMYSERFALDRLEMADDYRGSVAYARAKRAQVVWTVALQAREPAEGLDFSLVHPGWAKTPGVADSLPTFSRALGPLLRTPAEGVDTLVWLCSLDPGIPAGGRLWLDRQPRPFYRLSSTRVSDERLAEQGTELLAWLDRAIEATT